MTSSVRSITSLWGEYEANGKRLNNVRARDDLHLTDCKVHGTACSALGGVLALGSIFQKTIQAKDVVFLENSAVQETIVSLQSSVVVADSILSGRVSAKGDILLNQTAFTNVESFEGNVTCYGWEPPFFIKPDGHNVAAGDNIELENVWLNGFITSGGEVKAKGSRLGEIWALEKIDLEDSTFSSITGEGNVTCQNSSIDPTKFQGTSIEAEGTVKLKNIRLSKKVISKSGNVVARGCFIDSIEAAKAIDLKNTTVAATVASNLMCFLKNSQVIGTVSCGSCLVLDNSRVGSVVMILAAQKIQNLTICLRKGSIIEGDIIVRPFFNEGDATRDPQECMIEIRGSGTIRGRVKFEHCKGRTFHTAGVDYAGSKIP